MATVALFHRKQTLSKKQMAGIAAGAAVAGAATAMFLTPKTGKEMRGHAYGGARRVKHKAGRMARSTMHKSVPAQMTGQDSHVWSESNQDNPTGGAPRSTAS